MEKLIRVSIETDLAGICIKKRKADGTFGSSQGLPYEIMELNVDNLPQPSPSAPVTAAVHQTPYEKELIAQPLDGVFQIHTTRDLNNHWANPVKAIERDEHGNFGQRSRRAGPIQKAILHAVLPRVGKLPGDKLEEKDWAELVKLATENGPAGFQLVRGQAEKTEIVKGKTKVTKAVKEGRLVVHTETRTLCLQSPHPRSFSYHILPDTFVTHQAICKEPDCLSYCCTTLSNPWCKNHVGPKVFGVGECWVDGEEEGSIFSCVFSYGQEEVASEERKRELFNKFMTNARKGFIRTDLDYTLLRKRIFSNPEDAEAYLGLLQTTRLFAKIGGDKYKGKPYKILNIRSSLSLKMEEQMDARLQTKHGLMLTCKSTTTEHHLPPELGRLTRPNENPLDGEGNIYFQWDSNVNYSGIKIGTGATRTHSHKTRYASVGRYEERERKKLISTSIVINSDEQLSLTEEVVNFSNFVAHLFKVPNPLSKQDFICLNKRIDTTSIIENWELVKAFCQCFFKVDVDLVNV